MANTYIAIATTTVGSGGAASITFSTIPSTYTDLVIKYSTRATSSGTDWITVSFNTGGTYSYIYLLGTGSSAVNGTFRAAINQNSTFTASTFANGEVYIPNYTGSNSKSFSADSVNENNATEAYSALGAGLWSGTAAITDITLATDNGTNLAQYSTATLYGIKKD